jgi:ATPase subunit of ABC transporter with duplicated ATPase domains
MWADRGVRQARAKAPDKDKHRLSAQVNRTEKLASKIKITQRMLERLEVVDEPRKEWELRMTIAAAPRSGTVAATLRDAVVSRSGFTLGPVNLQLNWADRVAVTGPNGSGKSTLMGALLGRVPRGSGSASLGSGTDQYPSPAGSPCRTARSPRPPCPEFRSRGPPLSGRGPHRRCRARARA